MNGLAVLVAGGTIAVLALVLVWRPIIALMLFALMAPLGMQQLPGSLDIVTVLAALVIAVAFWEYLRSGGSPIPSSWITIGACLWSIGVVASVAFSTDPSHSAVLGVWQILAAWLAVAISHLAGDSRRLAPVMVCVLVGATAVAASGLGGGLQLEVQFGGSIVDGRATGTFAQPNEYGLYCAMVWAFALTVAGLTRGGLRWLAVVCAIVSLAGMGASFSRGAWLGALAAAVVMAALVPQTRRPQAVALSLSVLGLATALVMLPYWQLPRLLLTRFLSIFVAETSPYDNRPALVEEGLRQFAQAPVFGIGPNMYPLQSRTLESGVRTLEGQHAHNLVVTIAAEQGIVGLVALSMIVAAVVSAVRTARRANGMPRRGFPRRASLAATVTLSTVGPLTVVLAAGLVDYPLRNALTRLTVWMFIGLAVAGQRALLHEPDQTGDPTDHSSTSGMAQAEGPHSLGETQAMTK
jgi:O-antigen ligase